MATHNSAEDRGDHISSFPTFMEQEDSSPEDPSGGLVLASTQRSRSRASGPLAGQDPRSRAVVTDLPQGVCDHEEPMVLPPADATPQTYGTAMMQPRLHSAPAETRSAWLSPDVILTHRGGIPNAATDDDHYYPAGPWSSTPTPVQQTGRVAAPVEVQSAAPM